MRTIRASSADLVWSCPPSKDPAVGLITIDGDNEAARNGTAVHTVMKSSIASGRLVSEEIPGIASAALADPKEVAMLSYMAWNMWEQIAPNYPAATMEYELECIHQLDRNYNDVLVADLLSITGHPDVYSVVGDEVRLIDWKTGRKEKSWLHQLLAYGWLILRWNPKVNVFHANVAMVRNQELLGYKWTRAELEAWADKFHERILETDYNPGEHCGFCPRCATCPAKTAMLRQAWQALISAEAIDTGLGLPMDQAKEDEFIVGIYSKAKQMEKVADDVLKVVKGHVEMRGGQIDDGKTSLQLVDEPRDSVNWQAAKKTVQALLPEEAIDRCLAISRPKLIDEVWQVRKATGDRKSVAIKGVFDALKADGAIHSGVCTKLVSRPIKDLPF